MKDISSIGSDLNVIDTITVRARNILQVQIGSLEYAPELGIDLAYFLSEEFRFQTDAFRSYLIQRLAAYSINVTSVMGLKFDLGQNYVFTITPNATDSALISR